MNKKEQNAKYYKQTKEYHNRKSLEYYYRHKEKLLKQNKINHQEKYKNNPEYKRKLLENSRKRYWENREWHINYGREYVKKNRREMLEFVGGSKGVQCNKCGFKDERAIQIDHVNGGGSKEIKSLKNNRRYLALIKSRPDNYQLLCANCNWIKRHTNYEGHAK